MGCGKDTTIRRRYAHISDDQAIKRTVNNKETRFIPFRLLTAENQAKVNAHEQQQRAAAIYKEFQEQDREARLAAAELEMSLEDREEIWRAFGSKSQKQKDKALARFHAVNAFKARCYEYGMSEGEAVEETAKEYGFHPQSIRNWVRKAEGGVQADRVAVLVNQARGNREKVEFTPEAWVSFKKDWLRRGRPSIASCYRRLQAVARVNGWTIPIKRTLENWIKRELDPMVIKYRREGMEAVEKCFPAMKRNKEIFNVLEAVNGDGFELGVWADFGNGVIVKPIVWSWQDIRSSKILAWRIDVSENRELLRLATLDLITDWGIPKYFYLDNTRAAASKQISGGLPNRYRFKVKDDDPLGIIPMIGSELKYVLPASGRSKPIERVHGIGGYSDFISLPVFVGRGTKGRPIPIDELEEVFRSFVNEINARPDRQGEAVKGKSFDQVFNELYPEAIITKATEKQRKYCMCVAEVVMVSNADASVTLKAGKASFGENRYWHEALTKYMGQKVTARFDPADMHGGIYVETLAGEEICFAEATHTGGFKDAAAGREVARAKGHFKKAVKAKAEAEERLTAAEARAQTPLVPEPEKPPVGKVTRLLPNVNPGRKAALSNCTETDQDMDRFARAVGKLVEQDRRKVRI
ncbi:MAG TPA: transposase domain-containing protein [Geobacteraceae bacterium]